MEYQVKLEYIVEAENAVAASDTIELDEKVEHKIKELTISVVERKPF